MSITPYQIDALTELINIGVGRSAGMLNQIINAHVKLQVPSVQIFPSSRLEDILPMIAKMSLAVISLTFKGPFSGTALLAFRPESATTLVNLLTGEELDVSDLDSIRVGALTEVGNIVLNGVMGSISNVLRERLTYSIPVYIEDTIEHLLCERSREADSTIILAETSLHIEQLQIQGNLLLLFKVDLFQTLVHVLDGA
jgi:chemotaxis protein CheC